MQPITEISAVQRKLRDGIAKGYWTLEDLDVPPPGFIGTEHRNLLRDEPIPPTQANKAPAAAPAATSDIPF